MCFLESKSRTWTKQSLEFRLPYLLNVKVTLKGQMWNLMTSYRIFLFFCLCLIYLNLNYNLKPIVKFSLFSNVLNRGGGGHDNHTAKFYSNMNHTISFLRPLNDAKFCLTRFTSVNFTICSIRIYFKLPVIIYFSVFK